MHPQIGTSILLHREPTPGLRGFLTDAARTLYGTRQLGPAVGGLALTAAPAATLLTQSALLLLTGSDYCSTLVRACHPVPASPCLEVPCCRRCTPRKRRPHAYGWLDKHGTAL